MKGKILITDSLFIFKQHEELIKGAGYDIERLDAPEATEEQLVEAIKGKVGYILGGIEKVTEKVVEAADELKVISLLELMLMVSFLLLIVQLIKVLQ